MPSDQAPQLAPLIPGSSVFRVQLCHDLTRKLRTLRDKRGSPSASYKVLG